MKTKTMNIEGNEVTLQVPETDLDRLKAQMDSHLSAVKYDVNIGRTAGVEGAKANAEAAKAIAILMAAMINKGRENL